MVIDLTGQRFGKLTVLERDSRENHPGKRTAYWICKCDCGNIKVVEGNSLRSGKTKSCGCYRLEQLREAITLDLVGQKFGKLTVISSVETIIEPSGTRRTAYLCRCDCGNEVIAKTINLRAGDTSSCGCIYSKGEWNIEQILKQNNIPYEKQYSFDDLLSEKGHKMKFDFAIFNEKHELIKLIEFQGEQHYKKVHGWDDDERFQIRQMRDKKKENYCKEKGIELLAIPYSKLNKIDLALITGGQNGTDNN